jgi:hypothetical protein
MCTVHQGIPARSLTRSACEHSNTQRTKASPRPMPWRRPPQNDGASQEGATPKLGAVRGTIWRPSERWRSWWDGEFESPLLQRRVTSEPIVEKIENKGEPVRKRLMLSRAG